ncbi:MAG: phage tail protein [Lachnospiraceae bacterium]|nr:phage tail protein [Lachnospiraceae bacterium]
MYVTVQGECWDEVAKAVYGNEKYTGYLMQSNMKLLDIVVFSAGTRINTPQLPADESALPVWRRKA